MDFEYNKMSLHSDLVEIAEKYDERLTVEQTGHTIVQYGTEYMLHNCPIPLIAIISANRAIADAYDNFRQGDK